MSETATGGQSGASEGTEARQSMATGTESRKSKRLLIVGGLAALLLIGGGTTVFVEKGKRFQNMKENVFNGADHALHPPIVLAIPPIISNLDSGDGRPVYVKLTAKVEISGARDEASLITLIPRVQDIFQTYLHETRPQDIRGDGIYRLREAIMRRLRAELTPLQVTNLYLVEFLIQ
ncbi:flagellar basal body-associated FliL family protein [Gluconacetobacter takamatsuzukensis]|uniref:Flagellar protein FliL n=1 Tax=Gluconacetobacter takamatsuzukensis TaxID=1286190 RepID=A0A7W4KAZ0_9PROT|nr:flagellar basal body-associated FliL family protein [Gluconacetobacter takamatsuzukensis]MBB2203593.1 flagellar basal body-associated protein FliL [Gluconacetobacter takamatsuzukensis]